MVVKKLQIKCILNTCLHIELNAQNDFWIQILTITLYKPIIIIKLIFNVTQKYL